MGSGVGGCCGEVVSPPLLDNNIDDILRGETPSQTVQGSSIVYDRLSAERVMQNPINQSFWGFCTDHTPVPQLEMTKNRAFTPLFH